MGWEGCGMGLDFVPVKNIELTRAEDHNTLKIDTHRPRTTILLRSIVFLNFSIR